jgi:hypothetical protein
MQSAAHPSGRANHVEHCAPLLVCSRPFLLPVTRPLLMRVTRTPQVRRAPTAQQFSSAIPTIVLHFAAAGGCMPSTGGTSRYHTTGSGPPAHALSPAPSQSSAQVPAPGVELASKSL